MIQRVHRWLRRAVGPDFSRRYRWNLNPRNSASQGGEDGIIAEIFRRLGVEQGRFVEFGAWDGVRYSNTFALVRRGWQGVAIEGDPDKAAELRRNMEPYPGVTPVCRYVSLEAEGRLDAILAGTPCPRTFDLLSIDIDGNDYWIWESLREYTPKVVAIEYNPNFTPQERKTIPYDPAHRWGGTMFYGASAAALDALGRHKGYSLVAYTRKLNLFFVRGELAAGRFQPLELRSVPTGPLHGQRRREEFVDV